MFFSLLADGIYLATHSGQALPSTIHLYQIDLRFSPEPVFRCDALAVLHITNPLSGPGSIMSPSIVQHLQLLPPTSGRPFSIAVALAARDGNGRRRRERKMGVKNTWKRIPLDFTNALCR